MTADFETTLKAQMDDFLEKHQNVTNYIPETEEKLSQITSKSLYAADMTDRILTQQTEVENLIRRNKTDVDSIKCDISDAKAALKVIRNNLDEIKLNTEKIYGCCSWSQGGK